MSQKRFTLLISLIICQVVFLNVFVFGESETKVEGKLDERTPVIIVCLPSSITAFIGHELPSVSGVLIFPIRWLNETSFSLIFCCLQFPENLSMYQLAMLMIPQLHSAGLSQKIQMVLSKAIESIS